MKFQVGDIVEAFGCTGRVHALGCDNYGQIIEVYFEYGHNAIFSGEGKLYSWHKEPSLKLIERQILTTDEIKKALQIFIEMNPIEKMEKELAKGKWNIVLEDKKVEDAHTGT